ncbi:MAG: (d)CMP kinase [Thiohalobacterales bacterium]
MKIPVITIDGPSGSGKGTISQRLARQLGWHYLDSGALYRLLACAAQRDGVTLDDVDGLVALANRIHAEFRTNATGDESVLLDGVSVTTELRTEQAGSAASQIAALPPVRAALLDWQRRYRQPPGLVADGRDMGTVVFPDASTKIFLTASPGERARRRYNQLINMKKEVSLEAVMAEVRARDERDRSRSVAPLVPAADAHLLDNSALDIEETVARVLEHARSLT